MGPPVEGNHPAHALELVHHHEVVLGLEELHGVGRQHPPREAGGHAEVARLVVARIAGARLEERLAARPERREALAVEDRGRRAAPLVTG
jgi:hypothetical protein